MNKTEFIDQIHGTLVGCVVVCLNEKLLHVCINYNASEVHLRELNTCKCLSSMTIVVDEECPTARFCVRTSPEMLTRLREKYGGIISDAWWRVAKDVNQSHTHDKFPPRGIGQILEVIDGIT